MAPVWFKEDFLGEGGLELGNTVDRWENVDAGNATEALLADTETGVYQLALTNTGENQDAVLYWADQTPIDVLNDVQFECRVGFSVLPTGAVSDAVAVWGMCGDHNLDKDTIVESAWFRLQATGDLLIETDDGATNTDDTDCSELLVAGEYHIYRIDFSDLSDVKFYLDGERVGSGTTHDLSGLSVASGLMQPYFSLDKTTASTAVGTMEIDYVTIWGARSSRVANS